MARSTQRTIRRTSTPLARELLRLANDAHLISARAKRLSDKVNRAELDALALELRMRHEGGEPAE